MNIPDVLEKNVYSSVGGGEFNKWQLDTHNCVIHVFLTDFVTTCSINYQEKGIENSNCHCVFVYFFLSSASFYFIYLETLLFYEYTFRTIVFLMNRPFLCINKCSSLPLVMLLYPEVYFIRY